MTDKVRQIINEFFEKAQDYADEYSGCKKVKVGCAILSKTGYIVYGANRGIGYDCIKSGCRRVKLYGDDSKQHRLPSDCNSIHSEVDAISRAASEGIDTTDAIMVITRYPCEACARAITSAGIKEVFYGRDEEISSYTASIFEAGGVAAHHVDWKAPDKNN